MNWDFWEFTSGVLGVLQVYTLDVFCEKGVRRNFAKFTENTCARISFLIKLQKRDSGTGVLL